jgi:uncharacterized protein (DUF302 family)
METAPGIASILSLYPVEETVARLKAAIASKGLQLFAHIDHGAGAAAVGLTMLPAHVLIFGQAKAGTPLMVARPLLALDLPLKVLVWQDKEGQVWVSSNTPEFLAERHALPADLTGPLRAVEALVRGALA